MSPDFEKLVFFADHCADPVLITDGDFDGGPKIEYANDAFLTLSEYRRDEVVGQHPRFLQSAKTDRAVLRRIKSLLLNHETVKETVLNVSKSGLEYYSELHISYVFDDNKKIRHCVSIQRDVTKFVRLNEKLTDEINYNKILFDESPYAKIVVEYDGTIISANKFAHKLFSYDDLVGLNYRALMPAAITEIHEKHHSNFITTDSNYGVSLDMFGDRVVFGRRKTGENVPISVSLRKFDYEHHDCIILACKDQSVLYEKSQGLKKLIIDLGLERNKALSEYGSQTTFLMNMSHELRTPLNAILGFCELLEMSSIDERQEEYLDYIKQSGRTLLHQYEQLLELSNITCRRVEGEIFVLSTTVNKMIKSISTILNAAHLNDDIMIDSMPLHSDVKLTVDVEVVQKVMMNLVANSVKYRRDGVDSFVRIYVVPTIEKLRFVVEDNGVGIKQIHREKILKLFGRGDNYYISGFGIGLSIVQMLLKQIGSELEIDSDGETYTKMSFAVPA